jgi:prolyl oligopeptidase
MYEKLGTNEIGESLKKLTNIDEYSIPKKINGKYFYTSKNPSEKQHRLFVQNSLNESSHVIIDPNLLQTNICIENFVLSPNGNYLAFSTSENGSDWLTCQVMNVNSESNLIDCVKKIKFFPIVWSADSKGFFYSRFDSDSFHSIHYHTLGSEQSQDQLIYQDLSDGSVGYTPFITRDNCYLIIDAFNGSSGPNSISALDLEFASSIPVKIIPCDGANYWFICSKDTKCYFLTNKDADFRKVIYVDITDKSYKKNGFIPEGKFLLESVAPIGDYFCIVISENVVNKLALFDKQGKFASYITLPSQGKVSLNRITQNSIAAENEIFFSLRLLQN